MNVYYDVKQVVFCFDQKRIPVSLTTEKKRFNICKVLDTRHVVLSGGTAVRYTCIIDGEVRYLYFWNNRWLLEGHEKAAIQEEADEFLYM